MIESIAVSLVAALSAGTAKALSDVISEYIGDFQKKKEVKITLPDGSEFDVSKDLDADSLSIALQKIEESVGIEEASDRAEEFISGVRRTTAAQRDERRLQAKLTFFAALAFSIVGAIVIIVGVVLMFAGDTIVGGAITTASGVISGVISGILFKLNTDTNDRLDAVMTDTQKLEKAQFALEMAGKIENPKERDAAIREAMKKL